MTAKDASAISAMIAQAVATALANNAPVEGAHIMANGKKSPKLAAIDTAEEEAEIERTFIDASAVATKSKALLAHGLRQQAVWGKKGGKTGPMQRIKLMGTGFEISANSLAELVAGVNALVKAHAAKLIVVAS